MTPVVVGSELYGDSPAIARDVDAGGLVVELAMPLPLGEAVDVHFSCDRDEGRRDEMTARAVIREVRCLNANSSGEPTALRRYRLRFVSFDDQVPPERLLDGWGMNALLH